MFSFLRNGDIHNMMRGLTNLPGIFSSDHDKIKYALLNHSMAMRANLSDGSPIFKNIREWEAELERRDIESITSGRLPSMAANAAAAASKCVSPFGDTDINIRIDNVALAVIMAKELAFLNRTIQMISLIARRYQEEQEESQIQWGRNDDGSDVDSYCYDNDLGVSPQSLDEEEEEEDLEQASGKLLYRSHSHATNEYGGGSRGVSSSSSGGTNQLSATFLIASGRLIERFHNLCALTGANIVDVNGMTTMDRPHNEANMRKQYTAQSIVISDIFLYFCKFDAEHRDPVVDAFLELRDISVSAWKIMSMFAFSNLFRLTEGTEFAIYQPDDAIFTQGHHYRLHTEKAAVVSFPSISTTEQETTTDVHP
jgi:hypothetical protein